MKKTILFSCLFILTSFLATAQVQKLHELTTGKVIDSKVIYEEGSGDVFGYFFLYERDRFDKKLFEFEYVILDKNLNKLSSKFFSQSIYRMDLIKLEPRLSFVVKKGAEIIFGLHDSLGEGAPSYIMYGHYNSRYRKINLNDYNLSNTYYLAGNILNEQNDNNLEEENENLDYAKMGEKQTIFPLTGDKFLLFGVQDGVPHKFPKVILGNSYYRNSRAEIQSFRILNTDFETVANVPINRNSKEDIFYRYDANDKDLLILKKRNVPKFKSGEYNYEAFDIKTGEPIGEFSYEDKEAGYKLIQVGETQFTENHVIFYFDYYNIKKKTDNKFKLGVAKYVLDKKTFNVLSKDFFDIQDMTDLLTTDPKRKARDVYFVANDLKKLKNGKTLAFFKLYYKKRTKNFNEIYAIEFDKDFKTSNFYRAGENEKGVEYKQLQKLDEDGNYAFFYLIIDSMRRNLLGNYKYDYSLGIITYVDEEFEVTRLPLKKEGSKIYPGIAKNGYIRIIEETKDSYEIRLEKVNY